MERFDSISERVRYFRAAGIGAPRREPEDEPSPTARQASAAAAENRRVSDDLTVLLFLYGADGSERSLSAQGDHVVWHNYPYSGSFHKHEFIEILYVIEGSFTQILLGEKRCFTQGEFVITDQNCEHADYIEAADAAVLFLQIRASYMESLMRSYDNTDEMRRFLFHALWRRKREQSFLELRRRGWSSEQGADMERLLERLTEENLRREAGYEMVERGLLVRLMQHLCQEYTPQRHSNDRDSREKAFLYELECYIRTNAATVTAADLEQRFHYHRNYYNLLLKKYRAQSFRQYVTEVRLKYARQLLEQTDLSVRQIAQQVGYENVSHFYHLFESYFHKTPREMR